LEEGNIVDRDAKAQPARRQRGWAIAVRYQCVIASIHRRGRTDEGARAVAKEEFFDSAADLRSEAADCRAARARYRLT